MNTSISCILHFKCETTEGVLEGYSKMVTFVTDENQLRIGEQILPWSGDSDINLVSERYEIRIVDICRRTGGHYEPTYFCEVRLASKSACTGKPREPRQISKKELTDDWLLLEGLYKSRTWKADLKEGTTFVYLQFEKF